jgi:hypothetical protein
MRAEIFIAPHERIEAIREYGKYLSDDQSDEIEQRDDDGFWCILDIDYTGGHTFLTWKEDLAR